MVMVIWQIVCTYGSIVRIPTSTYGQLSSLNASPKTLCPNRERKKKKKVSPTGGGCQKPTPPYRRYKPYEEGKKEVSQPKKHPEEAAVLDISYARFRWNPPRLILPHSRKGDKTRQKSKQNAITYSLHPPPSPLFIGSSLIRPSPARRHGGADGHRQMLLPGQGDVPDADYEAPCITRPCQVRRHPDWILEK